MSGRCNYSSVASPAFRGWQLCCRHRLSCHPGLQITPADFLRVTSGLFHCMVVVFLHEVVGKNLLKLLNQVFVAPQGLLLDSIPVDVHLGLPITCGKAAQRSRSAARGGARPTRRFARTLASQRGQLKSGEAACRLQSQRAGDRPSAPRKQGAPNEASILPDRSGRQAEHSHWCVRARAAIWFSVTMIPTLVAGPPA